MFNVLEMKGYRLAKFNEEEDPRMPSGEIARRIRITPEHLKRNIRRYLAAGELKNTRIEFPDYKSENPPFQSEISPVSGLIVRKPKKDLGGRPEVEYYLCEHDTIFVIVKSKTALANAITHEVIDVFISVRKGLLPVHPAVAMNKAAALLENIAHVVSDLSERIKTLEARPPVNVNLPDDSALPIALERKRGKRPTMLKMLRHEGRVIATTMLRGGATYAEVTDVLKEKFPKIEITKSSLCRFWQRARAGKLKEFGIDVTVH
jgi:DNA-binding Lrp family transcriptional regulator